jgi:hypothetical protein
MDSKISELPEIVFLEEDDLLEASKKVGEGYESKKIKSSNVVPSGVITNSGDQTIGGVKTFTSFPVSPSGYPASDFEFANKKYVDNNPGAGSVLLTGDQTIAGTKTFSSFPVLPSGVPNADFQSAPKKYVDDSIGVAQSFTRDTGVFSAYQDVAQSLTGAEDEIYIYNKIKWIDSDFISYNTSTGIATFNKSGKFRVGAGAGIVSVSGEVIELSIIHNSTKVARNNVTPPGASLLTALPAVVIDANIGDTVFVKIYHSGAGEKNSYTSQEVSYFQISEEVAGNISITGTVELEGGEYICVGAETSVSFNVAGYGSDDLEILVSARTDRSGAEWDRLKMTFNNDAGSNYDCCLVGISNAGTSSSNDSGPGQAYLTAGTIDGATATSGMFSGISIRVMNFKSSTMHKFFNSEMFGHLTTTTYYQACSGVWKSTAGISSIKFAPMYGTGFVAGTRFKIYGKKTSAYPIVEGNTIQVMQKIQEQDITGSAVDSVTFSGLNGNLDKQYLLKFNIKSVSGSQAWYSIRPNGDSTSGNYRTQRHYTNDTTSSADSTVNLAGFDIGGSTVASEDIFGKIEIDAVSGRYRHSMQTYNDDQTGDIGWAVRAMSEWRNSSDSISSLVCVCNISGGYGVGSHLELWAVRTVKIGSVNTGSGEWKLKERKEFTSAATSYTFSGLDGNSARRYKIVSFLTSTLSGGTTLFLYCNTDTGNNNLYRYTTIAGHNDTSVSSQENGDYINLGYGNHSGCSVLTELIFHTKTGTKRPFKTETMYDMGSASNNYVLRIAGWYLNTTNNITQLVAVAENAGGIGIGSYIEVWELSQ